MWSREEFQVTPRVQPWADPRLRRCRLDCPFSNLRKFHETAEILGVFGKSGAFLYFLGLVSAWSQTRTHKLMESLFVTWRNVLESYLNSGFCILKDSATVRFDGNNQSTTVFGEN